MPTFWQSVDVICYLDEIPLYYYTFLITSFQIIRIDDVPQTLSREEDATGIK